MPVLISDPPLIGLFALALVVLVVGGLWLRYRKRSLLAVAGVLLVLLVAWFVAGLLLESPREESVRRVNDMAAALTAKDWAKFGENVSESFDWEGRKKADLKGPFDLAGRQNLRAAVWSFALTDPPRVSDTEVVISFEARASPPSGEPFLRRIEATFVKDPDGKFRLKGFSPFLPGTNTPATIP